MNSIKNKSSLNYFIILLCSISIIAIEPIYGKESFNEIGVEKNKAQLQNAIESGRADIAKKLIKEGVDFYLYKFEPYAPPKNSGPPIDGIVDPNDINDIRATLITAIIWDRTDIVKDIIEKNPGIRYRIINGQRGFGSDILGLAIRNDRTEVIKILIDAGMQVSWFEHDTAFCCRLNNALKELKRNSKEGRKKMNMKDFVWYFKESPRRLFNHDNKGVNVHIKNINELELLINTITEKSVMYLKDPISWDMSWVDRSLYLVLEDEFPLSSDLERAIIFGDRKAVKELAPSHVGYWGSCTPDKERALALAILTKETEIFHFLCDTWNVPLTKNILETVLDWLCFLEPTNLSLYLNGNT